MKIFKFYAKFITDAFSKKHQLKKFLEELKELEEEVEKEIENNNEKLDYSFLEEVADVLNMIEKLKYMYSNKKLDKEIEEIRKEKNERTIKKISNEQI